MIERNGFQSLGNGVKETLWSSCRRVLGNLFQTVGLSIVDLLAGKQPGHPLKQSKEIYGQDWTRPRYLGIDR